MSANDKRAVGKAALFARLGGNQMQSAHGGHLGKAADKGVSAMASS